MYQSGFNQERFNPNIDEFYTFVYIYTSIYIRIHLYIYIHPQINIYTYIHARMCLCVCVFITGDSWLNSLCQAVTMSHVGAQSAQGGRSEDHRQAGTQKE